MSCNRMEGLTLGCVRAPGKIMLISGLCNDNVSKPRIPEMPIL
jgi:hypothetical protein